MRWCIFYDDGACFDNGRGFPSDAPTHGAIVIVQQLADESHCQVLHQVDFFWWCEGMWRGGDIFGFLDQSATFGATWVKQGRTIRTALYRDILGEAVKLKDEWDLTGS